MLKKLLTVLGGLTVAAAVIPFAHQKDEVTGEESFRALVWNARITPDPEEMGKRSVSINLGFSNPLADDEYEHYEDELLLTSPAAEKAPACDINLVLPGEEEPEPDLVTL